MWKKMSEATFAKSRSYLSTYNWHHSLPKPSHPRNTLISRCCKTRCYLPGAAFSSSRALLYVGINGVVPSQTMQGLASGWKGRWPSGALQEPKSNAANMSSSTSLLSSSLSLFVPPVYLLSNLKCCQSSFAFLVRKVRPLFTTFSSSCKTSSLQIVV